MSHEPEDLPKSNFHQWGIVRGEDSISPINPISGEIKYNISTVEGQSGAPIILIDREGNMRIVGIHKGGKPISKGNTE